MSFDVASDCPNLRKRSKTALKRKLSWTEDAGDMSHHERPAAFSGPVKNHDLNIKPKDVKGGQGPTNEWLIENHSMRVWFKLLFSDPLAFLFALNF